VQRKSTIFASAFVIGLSGAMMPGPVLTASIGYTLERGFLAGGPLLILGHALLELALVVLVVAGIGPLLARPKVGAAIGIIGGAVLLWMGYGMIAAAIAGIGINAAHGPSMPLMHPTLAGALISLANPYWSLWWATIGLKYIALSRNSGRAGVAAFYCGHQLSDLAWYCLVAGGVALGRTFVPDAVYRWLIGACGLVLIAFALYFIVAAILALARSRKPQTAQAPSP